MANTVLRVLALLLAVVSSSCLLSCATAPKQAGSSRSYVNENLGLRVDLSDAWLLHTTSGAAPSAFRSFFPADKGPDDSPLYFGFRVGQQAFARALVEDAPLPTERYFELLVAAVGSEVETISARYSAEADAVRWIYRANVGIVEVTFHETVAVANGRGFRLGFWTETRQYEKYEAEFDLLATQFRFEKGGRWETRFENLDATLPDWDLAYVEITPQIFEAPEPIACAEGRRSLLWRVEHEGSVLHLFGSIHLGRPDFYPLADVVEQAFERSDFVVVEVDAASPEGVARVQEAIMGRTMLPSGETLEDVLSPGLYRRLERVLGDYGLPLETFAMLKPWVVGVSLSTMKMQALGYSPQHGVEKYLVDNLGERELLELESAAEQFEMFEGLSGDLFLAYTLDSLAELDETAEVIAAAWYCGRDEELANLLVGGEASSTGAGSEMLERIFFDRNETMAQRVEEMLDRPGRNYFVVVGAGHLVGDRGVPSLLESRGFAVVRQ